MECPICPHIKNGVIKYVTTAKLFFSKKFITDNYYKHFLLTLLIFTPLSYYINDFTGWDIYDFIPYSMCLGIFGFTMNFFYEWYMAAYKDCLFDYNDVIFGSYGAIIGAIISIVVSLV